MIIQLPLYVFLFIYFAFLAIFALFVVINFFHIYSSGTLTLVNFCVTVSIAAITVFILFATFQSLQGTDWQQTLHLFNPQWFGGTQLDSSF